jgi:hypothetical protein
VFADMHLKPGSRDASPASFHRLDADPDSHSHLSKVLLIGERSLRLALSEYVASWGA